MDFELQKPQLSQNQKLKMTYLMKRSLSILQMTNLELKEFIYSEIEKNPIIDIKINYSFSKKENFQFFSYKYKPSLFEHLLIQAKEHFNTKKELMIAENIIGNLDQKGYFTLDIDAFAKDLKVKKNLVNKILKIIKTFDPKGIATKNLQERILKNIDNKNSIEYEAFSKYFYLILKNKIDILAKNLKIKTKTLNKLIENLLKKVVFDPTSNFSSSNFVDISPDIIINKINNKWIIEIEENLPFIKINKSYVNHLENKKLGSSKKYLFLAKMLMKNILIRRQTLQKITSHIIKKQRLFILGKGKLNTLTLKEMATSLKVHPSTISRAISNKYIQCPLGLVPLKSLFSNSHKKKETLKTFENALNEILLEENKQKPFSDTELTKKLQQKNFNFNRRTVCKYRKKLYIGTSYQRKKYF